MSSKTGLRGVCWVGGSISIAAAFVAIWSLAGVGATPAHAQASSFCPAGFTFERGFCAKDIGFKPPGCPEGFGPVSFGCAGASSAALAVSTVSAVTQTLSRESTGVVEERLRERRRRGGQGEPLGPAVTAFAPVNAQYAADAPRLLAPAPLATSSSTTQTGVWAQVFGEYEKRDLRNTVSFLERVQTFNLDHTTRSGGVLGGIDAVVTNVFSPNDAIVFGALAGAMESTTRFKQSLAKLDLEGPSLGLYGFYALGPFSLELTFKTDLLHLDSRFADFLAATEPAAPIFGAFSGDLRNHTLVGNVKYRIDIGGAFLEPTAGLEFISTNYDRTTERFGLVDGDVLRGRAGARLGTSWSLDGVVLHPTLGAFVYSDLSVNGGEVPFGDVITETVMKADEGKLRGELQAALHIDFGRGFSSIARAEYRFGDDLQAFAGRLGLRYQW